MPANLQNSAVSTRLEKVNFYSNPKESNAKKCSNYCTIALISHASKVMLKILQARLQQYMNWELPDVQTGFRKGRGTRDQIASICWIIEKAREFLKNMYFCFTDYTKPLIVWITTSWEHLKEVRTPGHLTCLLRNLYAGQEETVRTGHGPMDWFHTGKGARTAVCCFPTYLSYMLCTSW